MIGIFDVLPFLKPRKRVALGVDISAKSVKLLQLAKYGQTWKIMAFGQAPLSSDAMDGMIIKNPEPITASIRTILAHNKFTAKDAVLAVPDSAVITKVVQLNAGLSDEEMEELVVLEADKHISYPIDEISVDFDVIGKSAKGADFIDVMLVASRIINVMGRADAANEAGLKATVVDVESFAIERAMTLIANQLPNEGKDKTIAFLDVGAVCSHLYIFHDLKVIFVKEEEFGGQYLVQALAVHLDKSIDEAAAAIKTGNLPDDYHAAVLVPFIEQLTLQIKRTLQFFYSTTPYSGLDHIVLAGGVSKTPVLVAKIQDLLNVTVSVANPLANIQIDNKVLAETLKSESASLMLACGLAMREID